MAFCPHCGKEISDGATACSACEREIKPSKSGADKFKGTILMPSADALKHVQSTQSRQTKTDAVPEQTVEKQPEPSQVEVNPQGAGGPEKPKRAFQATILGTGPAVAKAISDAKLEKSRSASVLQPGGAHPPSRDQGISSPSATSSPPPNLRGGTMLAGTIPSPIAPKVKPDEAPHQTATTARTENGDSSNLSSVGKTELAVPAMSMPVSEAQQSVSSDSGVPVLKQPEEFDSPLKATTSNNLGMWFAIGCFGMVVIGAIVGGIAYFLLS